MGIKQHVMLIYTDKEIQEAENWIKAKTKINPLDNDATAYFDSKHAIIHVNVQDTKLASDLIDSLVHELLHLKDKKLRHSNKFQEMVNNIIISG